MSAANKGMGKSIQADSFADRIKLLSERYGGVSQIARTCGFSEGVVRSWRDGRSDPSRARCVALARGLGLSLTWVVAGEGDMLESVATSTGTTPAPSGDKLDASRLAAAAEVLESTLRLAGADPSITLNSDLLGGYYELLGYTDPTQRARMAATLNQRVLERARQSREAKKTA